MNSNYTTFEQSNVKVANPKIRKTIFRHYQLLSKIGLYFYLTIKAKNQSFSKKLQNLNERNHANEHLIVHLSSQNPFHKRDIMETIPSSAKVTKDDNVFICHQAWIWQRPCDVIERTRIWTICLPASIIRDYSEIVHQGKMTGKRVWRTFFFVPLFHENRIWKKVQRMDYLGYCFRTFDHSFLVIPPQWKGWVGGDLGSVVLKECRDVSHWIFFNENIWKKLWWEAFLWV